MSKKLKNISVFLIIALLSQVILPVGLLSQQVYAAEEVPTEEVLPGIYYTTYISEINVSGARTRKKAQQPLIDAGFKVIDYDLNNGVGGDYIYLGYKTTTDYDIAIKDLWLTYQDKDYKEKQTIVVNDYNYYLVGCLGSESFINSKGNLNNGAGDPEKHYVHLYYSTEERKDKKGLVEIYFDRNMYNAVSDEYKIFEWGKPDYVTSDRDVYESIGVMNKVWHYGVGLNAGLQWAEDDIWMHITRANTGERVDAKKISSKNWMRQIPDNVKITALNIPGCHDAGTYHTTMPDSIGKLYANCQLYPIGDNVWINKHLTKKDTKVYEDGLLTQGYRYFDIRYGVDEFTLGGLRTPDSYGLRLVHNTVPCIYQFAESELGLPAYDFLTNDKLMEWIKKFLDDNPSETVILECSQDDGSDKDKTIENYQKFFSELAKNPNNSKYPKIYVGDHVPTLGEARGKIVVLAQNMSEEELKVGNNKYWGFRTANGAGDKDNKTTGEITEGMEEELQKKLKYKIYKNNQWDGVLEYGKWEWVNNGLNKSESILNESKNTGYDSFVCIYTSCNNASLAMDAPKDLIDKWKKLDPTKFESWITGVEYVGEAILQAVKGGIGYIERYSKYINPKLVARMQGDLSDKFVGIIATDNGGDNLATAIWQTNYNRRLPRSGSLFASGNIWVVAGMVAVVAVAGIGVVIYTRKRRKAKVTIK